MMKQKHNMNPNDRIIPATLTIVLKTIMIFLVTACFAGCNDDKDNYLEGSVTDGYDMNFDSVRVILYPESALSIEYVNKTETGDQVPLRVTIDHPETELVTGQDYDLQMEGNIVRGAAYASSPLPTLVSGSVRLDEFGSADGSKVTGEFKAVFTATNGAKINLRGGFSADLDRFER